MPYKHASHEDAAEGADDVTPADRKLLDLLVRGRDEFGVVAVKAEFEAEGTRADDLDRLLDLTRRAGLDAVLKIGGCEAISDLHLCARRNIDHIVAPMVETPYALSKFVAAAAMALGDGRPDTKLLFNVETAAALSNLDALVDVARGALDGIVFGRVDFAGSCGTARAGIDTQRVTDAVLTVAHACRDAGLELVVGGGVTVHSVGALRQMRAIGLTRFETRKIVFEGEAIESPTIEAGLANAIAFELGWLLAKRDWYDRIAREDDARTVMLQARADTFGPRTLGVPRKVGAA